MHPLSSIFIPNWTDLRPFAAELWLIATVVAVLLTPFFVRRPNSACATVALVGLALGLVSLIAVGPAETGPGYRFAPMLVSDGVAFLWKALLLLFVMGVVLMWFATTADTMREGDGPEYFCLLLGATLGMALMASASNLLMLFMAVEMASLPSYVLAGFRKTDRIGAEASLKYVLFGAAASAVMVYGLSLLYGLYGTLRLYPVALADGTVVPGLAQLAATQAASPTLAALAVLGLVVGIGFKVSAVPFHFWCPDVFQGASIDVTTFLSVASKGAGLVLLLRFAMAAAEAGGFAGSGPAIAAAGVIGALGAITCTVGNAAAYAQENVKRLLAYSSIAHAGYMLCAASLLVAGRGAKPGFQPADAAAQALLLYLAVYLFMNLGAFTVAGLVARQSGTEDVAGFYGLGRRSPVLALAMAACLFSLIGLPPLAGFVAKVNVLWVLIQNGGWWWALVAAIGVNTVLSLYYYARLLRAMYLRDSEEPAFVPHPLGTAIGVACAAALVLLMLAWSPLDRVTRGYGRLKAATTQAPAAPTPAGPPTTVPVAPSTQPVAAARD